jgi:hypothetical protein
MLSRCTPVFPIEEAGRGVRILVAEALVLDAFVLKCVRRVRRRNSRKLGYNETTIIPHEEKESGTCVAS